MLTPWWLIKLTNEVRSSRGVHPSRSPVSVQMRLSILRTFPASRATPMPVNRGHHLEVERLAVPVDVGPVARSPADPWVGDAGQQRRGALVPESEQGADDAGGVG
jgi:hypothetical protein